MVLNKRTACAGLLLLAALFLLTFVADNSEADVIDVDIFGGSDYTNLTQAVENATAGDTIRVAARTYYDTVLVNKQLAILGANDGGSGTDPGNIFGPSCDSGNLVARYDLDETSGSEADDSIWCNDLHGNLEGNASWESGVWENGIELDGDGDYIEVDHDSAFNITDAISIALWAKWDTNGTFSLVSTGEGGGAVTGGYDFFVYDNGHNGINHIGFYFDGEEDRSIGCDSDEDDDPLVKDTWYHLAVTYDKSKIKLYLNGVLLTECGATDSIGTHTQPFRIGRGYSYPSDTDDDFDGIIDDVGIWNTALSASTIKAFYWSGDGSYYPVVNASAGGYSFKITADNTVLTKFEVQYSGDDQTDDSNGDAGVFVDDAEDVRLDKIISKYNSYGIRLNHANRAKIYSVTIGCEDSHIDGLKNFQSDDIEVYRGNYDCATHAGIYSMYSKGGVYRDLNLDSNQRGIFFFATTSEPNSMSSNYINDTNIYNSGNAAIYFDGADNNTIYGCNLHDQWNAITFKWGANDNTVKEVDFQDSSNYDIYHGGCDVNGICGGWNNILIDNDFDDFDLYLDSASRLLEKSLVETTVTGNGTYPWNRVNSTIDTDRRAFSGTNSFWAGSAKDDTYLNNWNASFKLNTDVSLPSGGSEENRILEIKTWYKTEATFDGGRVYISKNSGTTWSLLTPIDGYDGNLQDTCNFDGGAFHGDKSALGWQTKKFNLSDYRGEDIRIKFNFCSDGSELGEGWYVDDVKIYKASDSRVVSYFDDFERIGHKWILAGDWVPEGSPDFVGRQKVDAIIVDGSSSEALLNQTLNPNLVNFWKFDESSGNTYDSVTGYYAGLYSGASYATGRFGNGLSLDGTNDYARNSNVMYSSGRYTEVTISAWVKFDSFPTSGNYESLVNPRYDGDAFIQVDSDGKPVFGGYFYGSPSGEQRATGSTTMVTGVWYHITGTWSEDTDKLKVYLNGTLDGTNSFSGTSAYLRSGYAYNYFGRDYNGRYMDGILDHVIIWSTDLSAADIQSLHNSPLGGGRLYATQHFGGADSKTNSDGKLVDLYVVTKVYAGSSTATSVDTYTGFRYNTWSQKIATGTISDNKLKVKIPDNRVYNRNDKSEYIYISDAVDASSSSDVIELWPGKYRENVVINKRLTIIGSGQSKTIVDGDYAASVFKFDNYQTDYSIIKNLRVSHSKTGTSNCGSASTYGGIHLYYSDHVTINNVHFFETYNGLMTYASTNLRVQNSTFDKGTVSGYYGMSICGTSGTTSTQSHYLIENNEVKKYNIGIGLQQLYEDINVYNNHIHNNSNYGIYINSVDYHLVDDHLEIVGNQIVDNRYGLSKGTSSSYGRYVLFKDNLVKSNSDYGILCYYYCQVWSVENNTFDGDSDTINGIYNRLGYGTKFGNNTFFNHTSQDLRITSCGTGSSSNKFFYNTYSSISVGGSCQIDIYNNLNVKTVDDDGAPFSGVDIGIKDSSQIYYSTPHWGGSDSLTDSSGFISESMFMRSGYYSSSSTLTSNNITVNLSYGIRAKSTWILFDEDTTESIVLQDYFRKGVVNNTNTGVLYTSISSAISSASTSDVLQVWSWTFNEQVVITKGITLVGNSTSSSIINGMDGEDPTDYTIEVKSDDVTISNLTLGKASDSVIYAGNFENLVISHISILSTDANNGIHFEGTESVTVSDVTINNTDRKSVLIEDGDTITFKNSNFKNSSASHGFEIDQSEQIILDNVFIHNPGYSSSSSYGISVSDSDQITIRNSTKVAYSKSYVIYIDTVSNLIVTNSTFIGDDLARIDESDSFLIENNIFKGSSEGNFSIYIKDTDSGTFQQNTITNPSSDGSTDNGAILLSSSSSNLIKDNTVTNSGRSGIHLKSASADNLIYGNTVTSSYYFGLYIYASDGNLIRNNTFTTSSSSGIKVSSSDGIEIDNNFLNSSTEYGLYVSSSDNIIVKFNSINENNIGIYATASKDGIFFENMIDDHASYGAYFQESTRLRFRDNVILNCDGDALSLSSNSHTAFYPISGIMIDNNTIKNNGDSTDGRAIKLSEVSFATLYNNSIKLNTYSGIELISSSSNKIVQNTIDGNGQYGIQITNDAEISDNNTIKDNVIEDNSNDGISSYGMFTKIINNEIIDNGQKGIILEESAARSTIFDCDLEDNAENAIHIFANHVSINDNIIDGSASDIAILVVNSNFVKIMNTTVEGGSQGIKFQNSTNAFVYKNTVQSNTGYGIYFMQNSTSAQIKNNTVMDNGQQSVYIHTSSSAIINGNTLKENTGYGLIVTNSSFLQINDNAINDNGGGVKFSDCDYCNVTSTSIKDNIARGIWLRSDSDNNSFTHVNSSDNGGSSNKDVYFQSSKDNKGFNFSFSTVTIDSSSTLTLTYNLDLVFQSSNGSGFSGMHFELISNGVQFYATPFYGGIGLVSDSDGEVGDSFSLGSKMYNGSSTPEIVPNILKYHHGVRSKEKSIDMSNSHTETVSVPSNWTKGLVRNADTGTDYHKIQYAIDNASTGHTLNVWAWTYYENVVVNKTLMIVGNSTTNTTLNATSNGKGFDITSVDVTIKNIEVISCGNTEGYNGIQVGGDAATIENVKVSQCHKGISVEGSGVWIGNSTFTSNYDLGINIYQGSSSSDAVKVYNNVVSWNTKGGIRSVEDDTVIKSNLIHNNSEGSGIYFEDADDSVIEDNIIKHNLFNVKYYNHAERVLIKNNVILGSENQGIYVGSNANYGVIEGNTVTDSGNIGIFIQSSDYYYLGNNTVSGSGNFDLKFDKATIGNSAKNTTFSTISINVNAYFAIYNDLSLTLVDASDSGFEGVDVKVVNDDNILYSTSHYGGTDNKTDSNGSISKNFTLIFEIYDGSSTPEVIPTNISARYLDWDETYSLEPSPTLQITVPDLRVKNNRTGEMSYHLQTAINNAESGDLIFAWAGIYYENIEIGKSLTIKGNGTSTIVNGTFSGTSNTAIQITYDNVRIKNLMILSAEKGILVDTSDDVSIENVKFSGVTSYEEYSLYVTDSKNLYVGNSVFDVDDYGIYFTGSSSNAVVRDNVFRNGSDSGDNCIFQSSSDETGDTQIINNTFDDCDAGWKSGSSNNIFRENTLNDNNYGIILNGIEAYGNLVEGNTIKDSNYGIRIYNNAQDNNLFSNTIQDSANSDIKLGESEDTISFNNTFSTIQVNSNANMWVKVYLDLTVYDNSSNAFSNADIEVKEDKSILYSTGYFGGSDDRTDVNGTIETFLVAISHYNGSSTPDDVTTNLSVRFVDWIISDTYNVSNSQSFSVPDFRVQNQNNGDMFYSISGAISASSTSNGHVIQAWTGTYRELITIDKQITLVGNGTSKTILNGSFEGTIITVSTDNVNIRNLSIMSSYDSSISEGTYRGIMLDSAGNCELDNLVLGYHYVGIYEDSQFNKISNSVIHHSNHGIKVTDGSASSIINNTFTDNIQGLLVYSAEEVIISNNTFNNNLKAVETDSSIDVTIRGNTFSNNDGEVIIIAFSDDITVHDNILQNNSLGVKIQSGSFDIVLYNNTIENSTSYGIYMDSSSSSIFSNNIIKMNFRAFEIRNSNSVTFISNTFVSNDYSSIYGYSGTNTLESNTFDDTGIAIEGADQILESNTIINSPEYGVKIHRNSYDNKLFNNTISNSADKDIFVGGLFNQTNNIGYNNTFSTIEVESNGEFIILDYVNVKTVNATGDKSGIDIRSYYSSSFYYRSTYFGGTDPLTNSSGDIPSFLAPVEHYDGSSTPDSVSLPVRARFVDWVETFYLDTSQGDSITIDIPDLRVKNIDTEAMSYHIQTAIDNAYVDDRIYVMAGLYLENVAVYKQITLATCKPESYSNCYTDGSVLIDAQQNGSAIKISEDGAEIRGFTVTNASSWPEAGIRVQADDTEVWGCNAYGSPIGILLQGASGTNLKSNSVFGTNIGIWLTASSNNFMDVTTIYDTSITDISFDSYGYADSEGSENNVLDRMRIKKINFTNSPNNLIQWPESIDYYQFEKVTLVNSQNVVSVGYDDPASIEIDSDSSYFVKNHVNIHVSQNGTFLSDVDVKIWNETEVFYSTPLFGGTDSKTVAGTIESVKTFAFKEYIGNSSGSENSIKVRIAYIDWTDETELSGSDGYPGFCHQCTIYADFDVPMFRVYNEDAEEYYYYIQPAIENATAGDTISLDSIEYNENIVIDKPLTLSGDSRDTTILTVDISGLGSPPLANSSLEGINITADDVVIENLQVSNFSLGIRIYDADRVKISNVRIMDTNGKGIWGLVWTTDLEIIDTIVDSAGGIGIEVHDNSAGFSLRDSVITNSQGGVTISTTGSYGASIDNVTVADNSNYGIHISAPGSTISNSTIENNGMNGIKLQAVTSANIENNTIFDNGLTEIYMVSSYNVDIYGNSISDEYDGVGISASASENVAISHNEMSLSIHLNSSYSQISDNNFTDIFGGSVSYDDAAMVISGNNNTISDNNIDNVELAFVFLYGNHDYNLVENNTLTFTSDDIWYYTSGMNNRFINTDLGIVDISEDSYFELLNYIDIEMSTINGPATNVELDVHYTSGPSIYNTGRYGGSDSKTDSSGTIERLFIVYQVFDGDYVPDTLETRVTYYYDGAEYNFTLDTSISHLVEIAVNLRPIASIDQISGIGDNPSTSTEEAVKGADILMMDNHTVAYWPFGEGSGQTVTDDTEAAYTGIIRPAAIWNEGRPNATDSSSVEFDGSFTNIETTATFELTEFTAEVWFKTDTTKKMVLFSDKDNSQKWGYNMYIDNGLAFDFTVNNGGQVFRLAPAESVTDNQWHFAAVVRDSSSVQLWLDGELVAGFSWSGDIDFTLSPIYIGQNPLGSESFKGLIDDLRFSDIARHNEDFMTGGGIVVFESDSYDPDGQISEYIWSSAIDGELGRGQTLYFAVDDLTQGSHNIQLHVMDDNGTFSVIPDSLVLLVMERPDSTIFSIAVNGDSVWSGWGSIEANSGDNISFKGRTNSQQSISEFSWASDQDGVISTVAEFDIDTLSNGTHAITFKLKGTNGLWSAEQEVRIDINGRPAIGNSHVTSETLDRLKSAMFKVRIEDDNTDGSSLVYDVGYRIKGGGGEWESEYISDTSYNSGTGDLEFTFTPDQNAPTGVYEFFVEATDEEGGVSDYYIMSQSITVQNNEPEIEQSSLDTDGEPLEFTTGTTIELGVDSTDQDGIVSTVIWYADNDGDGTLEEIGTGANFSFDNQLAPGENTIRVRVLDNEGGYSEQEFMVIVKEAPVEATLIDSLVEDFSSNLPLIALLGGGMVMVVGTILLRRRKVTEVVAEGLEVDDGVSEQPRETFDTLEWDIPTDAQGNALIIGEYMAKRRESYLTYPNNDEVLDYLHNNRERFQISSYFDVPAEPPVVLTDWALPDNLRGNVHLDSPRKQIVERITNSSPDKNFVIIGEPGVGKTVMMFEVFDRLMYQAPVGILTTDMIAKAHVLFGVRVFYDDIPENQKLVEALTDNEIQGVIVTSREADWKALPTEMQAKFDRLTVPLFNELDMKEMIKKMMTFQSIGFNEKAIDLLAEYSEGSPIYVWSMVREMMHRSVKSLSEEYIKENSIKGMINYVAQLLQRLLKDGEEYRSGGLHALASLIFLSDHMEERYCNDYFFDAYVEVLSKHTEEKLDDKMNPKTLNLVLAYLPINDSVIRFPHDTWPDVLQGWGDMNPFSSELRMINRLFADSGLFQSLKKEVVNDVWNSTYERYKRTPSRQKTSLLALADTLFQNFTIDELNELGVDIDIVRQVASTYSHIPQAAKLLSKIQAVLPQTVTRIINVQDIGSDKGHAPYKIQEMYLIYNDGRMITSLMDEEAKVDSDIMSSMLTAINDFVKDSFQTSGNLGSIDYGENQVILERGKHTILASVVYGEANRDLRSRMGRALTKIEDEFGSILKNWDGDIDSLSGSLKHLEPVMDLSKSVTKSMIDELQALKEVSLRSSWSQIAGFVQVNLMINNYSKKQLKGAKFSLEYGADYLKLIKTEPSLKHSVTEVELKPIKANDEVGVTLYFEPLKSTQASLNVHLDYEAKGGQSSGVSTAVFERVDLYKEGASLNVSSLDNASKAEIVTTTAPVEVVESTMGEVEIVEAEVEEVTDAPIEAIEMAAEVVEIVEAEVEEVADAPIVEVEMAAEVVEVVEAEVEEIVDESIEEIVMSSEVEEAEVIEAVPEAEVIEEPAEPAPDPGESGVDDLLSKLSELDDPENAPKKKGKKSDEEEDKSGMDDVLGKLDEL